MKSKWKKPRTEIPRCNGDSFGRQVYHIALNDHETASLTLPLPWNANDLDAVVDYITLLMKPLTERAK